MKPRRVFRLRHFIDGRHLACSGKHVYALRVRLERRSHAPPEFFRRIRPAARRSVQEESDLRSERLLVVVGHRLQEIPVTLLRHADRRKEPVTLGQEPRFIRHRVLPPLSQFLLLRCDELCHDLLDGRRGFASVRASSKGCISGLDEGAALVEDLLKRRCGRSAFFQIALEASCEALCPPLGLEAFFQSLVMRADRLADRAFACGEFHCPRRIFVFLCRALVPARPSVDLGKVFGSLFIEGRETREIVVEDMRRLM